MAIVSTPSRTTSAQDFSGSTNVRAMSIATMLFFMWGFLTSLNDVLIPHLKLIFSLNYSQVILVQVAFFTSYFIFAAPAGKLVEWRGYKQSMVIGLVVMAIGALLFLPAARVALFSVFLGAQVVLAAGITCLQVAANPYVANLGPQQTAPSRLNLAQAFNSLGTTIAPKLGSLVILAGTPLAADQLLKLAPAAQQQYRMQQASSVQMPYLGLAGALLVLALLFSLLRMPSLTFTQDLRPTDLDASSTNDSIFRHPQLLFGALAIFLYVGAEVAIGSFLINYISLPEIGHLTLKDAGNYLSLYWGGAMVGRFIGSALLQRVRAGAALGAVALVACILVATSILSLGHVAMLSIVAVGLFNSIMFPTIFTLGIENLGPLTSRGSSLMVAAIVGGAVIPFAQGWLADRVGIQHALLIPAVCYVYITAFGFGTLRQSRNTSLIATPVTDPL